MQKIKLISIVNDNPAFKYSLVAVVLLEILAFVMISSKHFIFDNHIGVAVFGGIPILSITLIQIYLGSVVQRANLVKDMAAKMHTDKELAQAFHFLVYGYPDTKFDEYLKSNEEQRKQMNIGRAEGQRFWDYKTVSGEEERLLDALLGFLDIVAYHYHSHLIQMKDIAGVLGYHLAILSTRRCITEYRKSITNFWSNSKTGKEFGSNAVPLRYLNVLLEDYLSYCKNQTVEI